MALIIPIDETIARFKFRMPLEDVFYVFEIEWSDVAEAWYLNLLSSTDEQLVVGVKLVVDYDLLGLYSQALLNIPQGVLMLYDTSGKGLECGRDDLGKRCLLMYQPSSELEVV